MMKENGRSIDSRRALTSGCAISQIVARIPNPPGPDRDECKKNGASEEVPSMPYHANHLALNIRRRLLTADCNEMTQPTSNIRRRTQVGYRSSVVAQVPSEESGFEGVDAISEAPQQAAGGPSAVREFLDADDIRFCGGKPRGNHSASLYANELPEVPGRTPRGHTIRWLPC